MKYRAFGDFRKGYAHVKHGSDVEDYASSYNDPAGRFNISVICDGHSDKNCFRSGKGAQYGCQSAIEIMRRFFELYLSQSDEVRTMPVGFEDRLKRSLKLCWDKKVYNDIKENPIKEDELASLTDRVKKIYEAETGLLNIYGATFLAIGICEDFFIALHIGDGVILCIDEDGYPYSPVPQDEKSETGAPASLCDTDLFSRKNAFRIYISKKLPQVATVSSDGIEDCMDSFEYKHFICLLLKKMEHEEVEGQQGYELNEKQKRYFASCLEYYAAKGHGAEDDCSLAVIYDLSRPVPDIKIPNEEAVELWNQAMQERNHVVDDYEKRKSELLESMAQVYGSFSFKDGVEASTEQWMKSHEKLEEMKSVLKTINTNENGKLAFYEKKLAFYSQYIDGFSEESSESKKQQPCQVDESLMESDEKYFELKKLRQNYQKKMANYKQLKNELADADRAIDDAYDEAKKMAKSSRDDVVTVDLLIKSVREKYHDTKEAYEKSFQEFEEEKTLYEQAKAEYLRNSEENVLNFSPQIKDICSSADKQLFHTVNDNLKIPNDGQEEKSTYRTEDIRTSQKSNRIEKTRAEEANTVRRKNIRLNLDIGWPWFWPKF